MDIEAFLNDHGVPFTRYDHPAVFTCEESALLCPEMPGTHTKNLFLRDRRGTRRILVVVSTEKSADLRGLKEMLHADKLSFASPERLKESLGVEPGSVTLLGLVHDPAHAVEVIIDREIWEADCVVCHPLVNTASLSIPHAGVETFLAATGHVPRVIDVPGRV